MNKIETIYKSAQAAEFMRLKPRTAHLHGLGACHIAIPPECMDKTYDRYYNPQTGAVVLIPREETAEEYVDALVMKRMRSAARAEKEMKKDVE